MATFTEKLHNRQIFQEEKDLYDNLIIPVPVKIKKEKEKGIFKRLIDVIYSEYKYRRRMLFFLMACFFTIINIGALSILNISVFYVSVILAWICVIKFIKT